MKVSGYVVPWVFNIQLALMPGNAWDEGYFCNGEAVWFGLGTKRWDRAYPDPENASVMSMAGWSIPLAVYIEKYDPYGYWTENDKQRKRQPAVEWINECVQLTPNLDGRTITLFRDPANPVTLDDLWYQGNLDSGALSGALSAVNSSVATNPLPDSRFASHAYFKFTFTKFKPKEETDWFGMPIAYWFPSVIFRLRVYYLELGEFIYVQEQGELPEWQGREWYKMFSPFGDWMQAFFSALGWWNPFNVFGPYSGFVAFLFLLGVLAIVIVVLLAIFAPWVLPRIAKTLGSTRREWRTSQEKG